MLITRKTTTTLLVLTLMTAEMQLSGAMSVRKSDGVSPVGSGGDGKRKSGRTGRARLGGPPVYSWDTGECGGGGKLLKRPHHHRQSRIIGGDPVSAPVPFQVSLEEWDNLMYKWRHICGGALISKHHVLTAAHCLKSGPRYRIIAGNLVMNRTELTEQTFEINPADITIHRQFHDSVEYANDIAIIRIVGEHGQGADLTSYVHPICIPRTRLWEKHLQEREARCIVLGWGQTHSYHAPNVEQLSPVLVAAEVPLQKDDTCRQIYNEDYNSLNNYLNAKGFKRITDGMLCAGPLDGRKDACDGDSGGPLACLVNDRYYLIGIVSWGDSCAKENRPGVYTRVSYYLDWINNEKLLLGPS